MIARGWQVVKTADMLGMRSAVCDCRVPTFCKQCMCLGIAAGCLRNPHRQSSGQGDDREDSSDDSDGGGVMRHA